MCIGIPGRITAMADVAGFLVGTVDYDGISRQVALAYLPEAQIGDYVLVSAQYAVRIITPAEAQETLALLRSVPQADKATPAVPR